MRAADSDSKSEPLNALGHAILGVDTRWVVLGALLILILFCLINRVGKKRWPSRDETQSLSLALLQLYSAPVLFAMLVLTEPPAFGLVGNLERQGAGLLGSIFLAFGVFIEIRKVWSGGSSNAPTDPQGVIASDKSPKPASTDNEVPAQKQPSPQGPVKKPEGT